MLENGNASGPSPTVAEPAARSLRPHRYNSNPKTQNISKKTPNQENSITSSGDGATAGVAEEQWKKKKASTRASQPADKPPPVSVGPTCSTIKAEGIAPTATTNQETNFEGTAPTAAPKKETNKVEETAPAATPNEGTNSGGAMAEVTEEQFTTGVKKTKKISKKKPPSARRASQRNVKPPPATVDSTKVEGIVQDTPNQESIVFGALGVTEEQFTGATGAMVGAREQLTGAVVVEERCTEVTEIAVEQRAESVASNQQRKRRSTDSQDEEEQSLKRSKAISKNDQCIPEMNAAAASEEKKKKPMYRNKWTYIKGINKYINDR